MRALTSLRKPILLLAALTFIGAIGAARDDAAPTAASMSSRWSTGAVRSAGGASGTPDATQVAHALAPAALVVQHGTAQEPSHVLEQKLAQIVGAISNDRLDDAMREVDALIVQHPTFRLAHLIRGDLLRARVQPLHRFGDVSKTAPQAAVDALRSEALARLNALREPPRNGLVPRDILKLYPDQQHAIIIDSRRSRLYLFKNVNDQARLVTDYYVTLGKQGVEKTREGDQKTPLGVYHVTASLPRSKLTDFYGVGAFPINYPNAWDRRLGRKGFGIWLHGTPSDTYSRPPRASDGCIVLANPDLETVGRQVQTGLTPVIIADEIEWTNESQLSQERGALEAALESWRSDWQSGDTNRYLAHYSKRFRAGDQDFGAWAQYKRRINAGKKWMRIGLSNSAMFRYPRERDFVVVVFDQDYRSNNLTNRMRKLQYWVLENGHWKILYEGAA